jgi:hypothetical protein
LESVLQDLFRQAEKTVSHQARSRGLERRVLLDLAGTGKLDLDDVHAGNLVRYILCTNKIPRCTEAKITASYSDAGREVARASKSIFPDSGRREASPGTHDEERSSSVGSGGSGGSTSPSPSPSASRAASPSPSPSLSASRAASPSDPGASGGSSWFHTLSPSHPDGSGWMP